MLVPVILLIASIAIILISAELFTNGIEWLGFNLKLRTCAIGSLLAAVGTALPETLLPIVAIVLLPNSGKDAIGIGAIIGAPFMLSTAAFFVTGAAVLMFSARGRRDSRMAVNSSILQRDIGYFIVVFAVVLATSFLPFQPLKQAVGLALLGAYALYVYLTLKAEGDLCQDLNPLRFARHVEEPAFLIISLQVIVSLAGIIFGAGVFVQNLEQVATFLAAPPLVLALILAPLATELPEKFNSVIWVREKKDTLALGNITGAMVFQSCIPAAVGLFLTPWVLDRPALVSGTIALLSAGIVYVSLRANGNLSPKVLMVGGAFYAAFVWYAISLL